MKLEIYDPNNVLDSNFGTWLCGRIQQHFVGILDTKKLEPWNNFFETHYASKLLYNNSVNTYELLKNGIRCLNSKKLPDKFVIALNRNQYVPGFDRLNLDTFFRLITFGNMSISGYPVFVETLQYFVDNINEIIELYDSGV